MWSAASIHQALSYRICSKASILHVSLSANGDAKHAWLWTLTPVFQLLLIHCRLAFWWFLVDSWPSWPIFSEQQVIVCLFFFSWLWQWHNGAIPFYLQTVVCALSLGTCNCIETAPSDFPDLLILPSFRSMLPIVVFVAEECIKQVLLKWAQKNWSVHNHSEEVKGPHYKADLIDTTI